MPLPKPAQVNAGIDHIANTYGADLADAYLLPADIGDPALRLHRATAVVAVDIARLLVAVRWTNDRIRAEVGPLAGYTPALSELAAYAEALDAALEVAMEAHQVQEARDVA
jgi:hypothetical protein